MYYASGLPVPSTDHSHYYHCFVIESSEQGSLSNDLSNDTLLQKFKEKDIKYANKQKTLQFISNPICTDVTQTNQTDIKTILNQNPDLSGLSVLLNDTQKYEARQDAVSIDDFLPETEFHDFLDYYQFIRNAQQKYDLLPTSIKQKYPDVAQLCTAIESKDSAALTALSNWLYGQPEPPKGSAIAPAAEQSSTVEIVNQPDQPNQPNQPN